jgi:hypothetical protein
MEGKIMSKKTKKTKKTNLKDVIYKQIKERKESSGSPTLTITKDEMFQIKNTKPLRLDILPYTVSDPKHPNQEVGELYYTRTFYVHKNVGASHLTFVCAQKTFGKPCPICDYRAKIIKDPETDEDLIKDISPKIRQLYNVVDYTNKDKGVQVWDISWHLFGKKLTDYLYNSDEEDDYYRFADIEDGLTLRLGLEQASWRGSTYYEVVSIEFKQRKNDYAGADADLLENVYDLDKILKVVDYEKLKNIFLEVMNEESENDIEDDSDDDLDLDEDDSDDDSDEEPATPKKNKKGRPPKKEKSKTASKPSKKTKTSKKIEDEDLDDSEDSEDDGIFEDDIDLDDLEDNDDDLEDNDEDLEDNDDDLEDNDDDFDDEDDLEDDDDDLEDDDDEFDDDDLD